MTTTEAPLRAGRTWIQQWDPEDEGFWAATGRRVANRNLIFSIFSEHLGFSLWSIWSVVVLSLPTAGFKFGVDQLFWLTALPNLIGATLRLPYTFAVPRFGGRNWAVVSSLMLLIPCALLTVAVTSHASFGFFLFAAATAGFGGGNFASSMTNISFFYPEIPLVISATTGVGLAVAGLFYMPFVIAAAICSALFMDNLATAKSDFPAQISAAKRSQTWVMSVLYIGTFGSFIGFSAALPLLIKTQFPTVHGTYFAWLGALVGSISRPVGGWLSDKVGGSRVTLWNFVLMGVAAAVVVAGERSGNFGLFFGAFLVLFVTAGVGNGSTYRMIPAIFVAQAKRETAEGADAVEAVRKGKREAAAAIGIVSAIGAFGGFFVTRIIASSVAATKVADNAFYGFIVFYVLCFAITWWFYLRRSFASAPSLATANV
jgi:NNP family nitrate/nitrite transporter-like MFS transporter